MFLRNLNQIGAFFVGHDLFEVADLIELTFILYFLLLLSLLWIIRPGNHGSEIALLSKNGSPIKEMKVVILKSWLRRRVGLLNHAVIPRESGVLLESKGAIHTQGMNASIDAVFLDKNNLIIHIEPHVKPGMKRISPPRSTKKTLELAGGKSNELGLKRGDQLEFKKYAI